MPKRRSAFLLAAAILLAAPAAQAAGIDVAKLLTPGAHRVEVMEVKPSQRAVELGLRLRRAQQANKGWFAEYVEKFARPGEPLPYHENLGLTPDEYKEFLASAEDTRAVPDRETTLIIRNDRGRLTLDGGEDLPELTGIVVDLEADAVQTPFGRAARRSVIEASPEQKSTGPWSGLSWKYQEGEINQRGRPVSGTTVQFSVGRLEESGRVILYYNARRAEEGKVMDRAVRVLRFKPAPGGGG